jgi:hypothetical protein
MRERKDYRAYFNSRHDGPDRFWSVDEGTQASERTVRLFILLQITAHTEINPDAVHPEPSGWIAVTNCFAEFKDGGVVFTNVEAEV